MTYHRFLTNKDYYCLATEEHMRQLIRGVEERIPQAEQRAEMQILEYLDQYYEVDKLLAVGKNIREYSHAISYPGQVWIRKDEEIYKTLTYINGIKKPTKVEYWRQLTEFIDPRLIDKAQKYSQLKTYPKGEVIKFGTEYWQCMVPHGYDSGEIHTPGIKAWKEAEITPWEPNMEWEKDQVCSFNGLFYQFLGEENGEEEQIVDPSPTPTEPDENTDEPEETETELEEEEDKKDSSLDEESEADPELPEDELVLTPEEDDRWGLIGEYSEELEYDFSEGVHDYVVAEDTVFFPVLNPNPDKLEEGVNITRDDPRNANIVAHLSRIALYHLHSIIAPTNIPETRRWAYEDSIQWLYNASKFKINPQLPRKHEHGSCMPKVDWACETFQRDFNPYENPWLT